MARRSSGEKEAIKQAEERQESQQVGSWLLKSDNPQDQIYGKALSNGELSLDSVKALKTIQQKGATPLEEAINNFLVEKMGLGEKQVNIENSIDSTSRESNSSLANMFDNKYDPGIVIPKGTLKSKSGNMSWVDLADTKKEAEALGEVKTEQSVAEQQAKVSAQQASYMQSGTSTALIGTELAAKSLLQTKDILKKMGIKGTFDRGLEGLAFSKITKAAADLGYNDYYDTYKGYIVEQAVDLAKSAAPSAKIGPDIMEEFAKTIPEVENQTIASGLNNTIWSMKGMAARFAARATDDTGKKLFKTQEEVTKFSEDYFTKYNRIIRNDYFQKGLIGYKTAELTPMTKTVNGKNVDLYVPNELVSKFKKEKWVSKYGK